MSPRGQIDVEPMRWKLITAWNRWRVRPFLVNSLPKSGTNLLARMLELAPGVERAGLLLDHYTIGQFRPEGWEHRPQVNLGVDFPVHACAATVEQRLATMPRGSFATGHVPCTPAFLEIADRLAMPITLVVRDPRDVVLSMARYIARTDSHYVHHVFRDADERERIRLAITGVAEQSDGSGLLGIDRRLDAIAGWRDHPRVLIVRFEDLVGARGGGDDKRQRAAVLAIAGHLGIILSAGMTDWICQHLFGRTKTFDRGQVGLWTREMPDELVDLFHHTVGDRLEAWGYAHDPRDEANWV